MMVPIVITAIVTLLIAVPVTALIASAQCKKGIEQKIGNADDKAREIIDEALKTAEAKKREGLLEVKEESIRTKNELDREIRNAEPRLPGTNAACSRRKRTSTRRPMRSRRKKLIWRSGKRRCGSRRKRFPD